MGNSSSSEKLKTSISLSDSEIFDLLNEAAKQFEDYKSAADLAQFNHCELVSQTILADWTYPLGLNFSTKT